MSNTRLSEFTIRRQKLTEKLPPNSIVILSSAPIANRNADMNYVYRQDSNFYYLTGFEEPDSVAILIPQNDKSEFILFNLPNDPEQEVITGKRAGQKGACEIFGADNSFPISELNTRLPLLLEKKEKIYYPIKTNKVIDEIVESYIATRRRTFRHGSPRVSLEDISYDIYEMRQIKSPEEIALMRKAVDISVDAHLRAIKACYPKEYEYVLEAEIMHEFLRNGARAPAYSNIVGSGENCCTLHYDKNSRIMENGELVLMDVGAEYQNYASDITRTFPVSGKFSPDQCAVYNIVLEAQEAGIKEVKPGASWKEVTESVEYVITAGLIKLEILQGDLKDLIKKKAYLPFYMHGPGHWLGLDVHDSGRYKDGDNYRIFKPGMLLTVEPGIYLNDRIQGLNPRWYNIGIRIEDDVLVTESGCEVLSRSLPKTIDAIEKIMSNRQERKNISSTAKTISDLNLKPENFENKLVQKANHATEHKHENQDKPCYSIISQVSACNRNLTPH